MQFAWGLIEVEVLKLLKCWVFTKIFYDYLTPGQLLIICQADFWYISSFLESVKVSINRICESFKAYAGNFKIAALRFLVIIGCFYLCEDARFFSQGVKSALSLFARFIHKSFIPAEIWFRRRRHAYLLPPVWNGFTLQPFENSLRIIIFLHLLWNAFCFKTLGCRNGNVWVLFNQAKDWELV